MLEHSPLPAALHRESRLDHLNHLIDEAAHLLPAQGPITVFIHHNTLHAFEDLQFDDAVQKGSQIFGCHPYLTEDRYRTELERDRIRHSDLQRVLREELGDQADEPILSFGTRFDLRMSMLQHRLRFGPDSELRWFIAETDALKRIHPEASALVRSQLIGRTRHWFMREVRGRETPSGTAGDGGLERRTQKMLAEIIQRFSEKAIESWSTDTWEAFAVEALWRICRDGLHGIPSRAPASNPPVRHRDLLLDVAHVDTDLQVHDILIRFCASFLDQGFSAWQLPGKETGFFQSFCSLYGPSGGPPDAWLQGLSQELIRLEQLGKTPSGSILESLELLGVPEEEWLEYLTATLLALRGWSGMILQIESRGDRVALPIPAHSLQGFVAIRLILERLALRHAAQTALGYEGPLSNLRQVLQTHVERHPAESLEQRAFQVFQLAQIRGWLPEQLLRLTKPEWIQLTQEIEAFSMLERRKLFHRAYEYRFLSKTLDAISIQSRRSPERIAAARFQAIFCLDEREESMRRHLEEVAPDVETFSTAGFYSVAMYYKGVAEAHYIPLCPVVIRPKNWVAERVVEAHAATGRQQATFRKLLGTAARHMHLGSRTFSGGMLLTAGIGILASIPLVGRILFPRLTGSIRRSAGKLVHAPHPTRLQLERTADISGPLVDHIGFSLEEMTNIAEKVLREIGLIDNFARLVFSFGHGSNSLNNPHKSAYDCGACGGSSGGPNGRAFAQILNDPRVRTNLASRGIRIPDGTFFIGGFHNTCDDSITMLDVDCIPETHRQEFVEAKRILDEACDRNAHERCRRFVSAPLDMSFSMARRHVEGRSEDLSQTRPECGHASNAICIIGRRSRTKGLFLDRRAFLTSYDPTQDDAESSILARILGAAVPVCAGINLEYYFSYVDSDGWGSGTKLPHNVSALVGVMDGAASDLRTGLPWQMVEIHEPVRLLFVIETTPAIMLQLMERSPGIGKLCHHDWIQLAVLDPHSSRIQVFRHGKFEDYQPQTHELPKANSSTDWYRGWRENLEFAAIG